MSARIGLRRSAALVAVASLAAAGCSGDDSSDDAAADGAVAETSSVSADATTDTAADTAADTTVAEGTGSSGGSADAELADAIAASLAADDAAATDIAFGSVFDTECMGTESVAALGGAERAESEYGITAAAVSADGDLLEGVALSESDAVALVGAYGSCGDFRELLTLGFTSSGATPEQADCVVSALPDDIVERSLVEDFQQIEDGPANAEFDAALATAAQSCLAES